LSSGGRVEQIAVILGFDEREPARYADQYRSESPAEVLLDGGA
jgi:hypothetical protein